MAGNSQRKGAVRKRGKGNTAGSGGRVRRGLEGKGPTPKAEDRPYHAAYRAKKAASRSAAAAATRSWRPAANRATGQRARSGWPVATRCWRRSRRRSRPRPRTSPRAPSATTGCATSSSSPPTRSLPLLEVTRSELDRLTGGAVHQGVALQLPAYDYAHPDDLLATALEADGRAADRGPGLDHRPAQPRRDHPLGGRLRRARGADPRAPVGRDDRRRLEDLGRCRGADPDRPGHQPEPDAARLRRRRACSWSAWTVSRTPTSPRWRRSSGPLVLVVGSEGDGLSRLVRETCDTVAAIPMRRRGGVAERRRRRRHRPLRDRPPPLTDSAVLQLPRSRDRAAHTDSGRRGSSLQPSARVDGPTCPEPVEGPSRAVEADPRQLDAKTSAGKVRR